MRGIQACILQFHATVSPVFPPTFPPGYSMFIVAVSTTAARVAQARRSTRPVIPLDTSTCTLQRVKFRVQLCVPVRTASPIGTPYLCEFNRL